MFVFAIMPFTEEFNHIYANIVKPVFEEEGFEIKRADELNNQHNILKDIVQGIGRADLIVTEVSEINANVFYELGIAHGLNKPTILIT